MAVPKVRAYAYISTDPEIAGGVPVIEETRVTVRTVVAYHRLGLGTDAMLEQLPDMSPAQIHAALAYYYDHRESIDPDFGEATADAYRRVISEDGRQRILEAATEAHREHAAGKLLASSSVDELMNDLLSDLES